MDLNVQVWNNVHDLVLSEKRKLQNNIDIGYKIPLRILRWQKGGRRN